MHTVRFLCEHVIQQVFHKIFSLTYHGVSVAHILDILEKSRRSFFL